MDKTQENFRQKLKLSHISIYSKSGPCKTARFSSDSNGTSGRKNAEAVQERFYNTLYDTLCKNQEGYNLICMINESGLKNNLEESMMSIINDMKEGYNYTSVMSIHFIRRITYEFLYNERSI